MEGLGADIIVPGRSSSPTPVISPVRQNGAPGLGVCSLCLSGPGKYTCPRCNGPYCSLACYKGPRHTACSELFYKEAVLQALREEEAGPRGRKGLEEMLLRLRQEEEGAGGDEDKAGGGTEPMNGVEAELWSALTPQEKKQFTKLLQSGAIGALVPRWKPWWDPEKIRQKKILELPEEADTSKTSSSDGGQANADHVREDCHDPVTAVPPMLTSIPPLYSLSRNPSPLVKYSVVSVLYSYAYSLLRHNGDVSDFDILLDFMGTLLSVSAALSTNAVYNSTAHALKSAVRAASDPQSGGDRSLACSAMEATSQILRSDDRKTYPLAAISHLSRLLGKVRKHITGDKEIRKAAFNARKKCLFLAAWMNENEGCLAVLAGEVMVEYKQYLDELSGVEEISRGLQKVWGGNRPPDKKKLVQEVERSTDQQ